MTHLYRAVKVPSRTKSVPTNPNEMEVVKDLTNPE